MPNVVLTLEDSSTYNIDCTGKDIEVSAFTDWYDTERLYNDSINLTKIHREEDIELSLRSILDILGEQKIIEIVWMQNDKELLKFTGDIIPRWNLQANPTLNEILNFTVSNNVEN